MAKPDITKNTASIDALLAVTENPRHRLILENYRRHALLESGGAWEKVLYDPAMVVPDPEYVLSFSGMTLRLQGQEQVAAMYGALRDNRANVFVVEDEDIMISDTGFASEVVATQHTVGANLQDLSKDELDPEGLYTRTARSLFIFPYTEDCVLKGERATDFDGAEIREVSADDFITPEEAYRLLVPLARPLPSLESLSV